MKGLFLVVVVLSVLLSACSFRLEGSPEVRFVEAPAERTGIWVSGEGKVTYMPDIALVTLGIESQAKTVREAQGRARETMSRVISVLKERGVAEKDIQTTHFGIQPVTEWVEEFPKRRKGVTVGYKVTNVVRVKIRKIEEVGSIIDAVAEAGGDLTRVHSISFTIEDTTLLYNEARKKAVKDAQAKAEQLARLLGVEVGKPTYISEGAIYIPREVVHIKTVPVPMPAPTPTPPTPITPGERELTLRVQVAFAIK